MRSAARSARATASGCCATSPVVPGGSAKSPVPWSRAPLAAVLILALGFGWIVWVGVGCGLVLALIYSTAYFDPSVDHRLAKHGYPSGTAHRILSERDTAKHPDRMHRYMQTYRDNTN